MAITLNGTTGITTPDITSTTSTLGTLTQALNLGSTGQIVFPATQSASANANTLDDYEEGTWTPVVTGTSTAGTGTYILQEGGYTKIGNTVVVSCYVAWTAHTGTGDFSITGLPFASTASTSVQAGSTYASDFNAGTSATSVATYPSAGTTTLSFRGFINNASRTIPALDTAATIGVNLTYRV